MPIKLEKLAAAGALAVSAGMLVVFAALIWIMWPNPAGGMSRTQFVVGVISSGGPIAALIAIHLALAKQLLDDAQRRTLAT